MTPDPEPPTAPEPPAPPLGTLVATDQAAAHVAEGHGRHGPFHPHCENCGTKLAGPYCHRCGQHDFEFHRSFGHVFFEALETLFHFEGKFFRNIVTLLFVPGRLTADFNAGKRAAQMPPFRLYVFVSFVFFLLIFLGEKPADPLITDAAGGGTLTAAQFGDVWREATAGMTDADWQDPAKVEHAIGQAAERTLAADGLPAGAAVRQQVQEELRAAAAGSKAAHARARSDKSNQSGFVRHLVEQGRRLGEPAQRQRLIHSIRSHLPHMLMFCLPLFALYTRVLFRKSGQVYLQHLVLAVHFHTFIYLWMLCGKGWAGLADLPGWGLGGWVTLGCNLWLWLYPVLMLRRLFAGSWPGTILKAGLLVFTYTLTLAFGFLLMAFALFLSA